MYTVTEVTTHRDGDIDVLPFMFAYPSLMAARKAVNEAAEQAVRWLDPVHHHQWTAYYTEKYEGEEVSRTTYYVQRVTMAE